MNKEVTGPLAWGAAILIVALGGRYARELGYADAETVKRLVIGMTGLMIAWMGNRMPKAFVPFDWARRFRRFAGWSLTLSGLIYTALWVFAPIPVARVLGAGAVLLGIAATVGYCFVLRARVKAA